MKLFRIWNPELHRFVDGEEWFASPSGAVYFWDQKEGVIFAPKCFVQLATNRRDKYGEIIYFGDKIHTKTHLSGQTYKSDLVVNDILVGAQLDWYQNDEIEIVGHINE